MVSNVFLEILRSTKTNPFTLSEIMNYTENGFSSVLVNEYTNEDGLNNLGAYAPILD